MPTLADVAAHAGVSIATVSKVLSNTPYFSEETKKRVLASVEAVGYIPNLAARALSSGKTGIIGVVFPRVFDTVFTDPFVQHVLEGVEAACNDSGHNLLLSTPSVRGNITDERYEQLLKSGYVEGLIALDNVPKASVVQPALEYDIPVVSIGYGPNDAYIRSDERGGAASVMQHVLEMGHRHIGLISVTDGLNYAVEPRVDGWRAAATTHDIDFDSLPICHGDFSTASGAMCAANLLRQNPNLTAIVCINDRMALGAIQHLRKQGLHIPSDISVVGYDDIPIAQFADPPLTTVNQHAPALGRRATEMLLSLLDNKHPEPEILPTELVVRQSSTIAKERTDLSIKDS